MILKEQGTVLAKIGHVPKNHQNAELCISECGIYILKNGNYEFLSLIAAVIYSTENAISSLLRRSFLRKLWRP